MGVVVPHGQLSEEALTGVIEQFIHREGTDYGEVEATPEQKVAQVRAQLARGEAVLLWDEESQSINIVTARELAKLGL